MSAVVLRVDRDEREKNERSAFILPGFIQGCGSLAIGR